MTKELLSLQLFAIALDKSNLGNEQIIIVTEERLKEIKAIAKPEMVDGAISYKRLPGANLNFFSIAVLGVTLHFTTSNNLMNLFNKP